VGRQVREEVRQREQHQAAPGAQALAQRLVGAELRGGAGDAVVPGEAAVPGDGRSLQDPRRGAVERGEHDLIGADALQGGRVAVAEQRPAQRPGEH